MKRHSDGSIEGTPEEIASYEQIARGKLRKMERAWVDEFHYVPRQRKKRIVKKTPRAMRHWEKTEILRYLQLLSEGKTLASISGELGRSKAALITIKKRYDAGWRPQH